MANTDITVTQAAQLAALNNQQLKAAACLGFSLVFLAQGTRVTNAQWDTLVASARQLFPQSYPQSNARELAAIAMAAGCSIAGTGLFPTTGATTNDIVDSSNYLMGLGEETVDKLFLYVLGKAFAVLT